MKKYKGLKSFVITLVLLITIALSIVKVSAATLKVNISASSNKIVVGNTVTYTVTVSSSELLGSIRYNFGYDSSKLTLVSGTLNAAPAFDGTKKSASYTFKFRAKASGTATVSFNIYEAIDWNFKNFSYTSKTTKTTTIITQAQLEASYSKNNYLSNLKVDGYSLSPTFNKDTSNYSLTLENDVRSINVTGSKADSTASVSGLGQHSLAEGVNKINISVTAQNGSTRTYVLNVTVKELTPIIAMVQNQEFNVVRKENLIEKPNSNFQETTIKIDEEEVPAFINEVTNTTLVGLKDKDGKIDLYIYKDGNYTLYKEYIFDSIIVTSISEKDVPEGYEKTTLKLDEDEIVAYKQINGDKDYYLIAATNVSTGEENLYQYNKKENTIQIYHNDSISKIEELEIQNKNSTYVIIALGTLLIITYIAILISNIRRNKRRKEYEKALKEKLAKASEPIEKPKIEEPIEENNEKNVKVNKEIEKKNKKDDKIKEDISNKSKKKKK